MEAAEDKANTSVLFRIPASPMHVNLIAKNRRESHNHRPNIKPKKLPQVEPRRGQERHAQSGIDHKTECLPISASINARKTSGDCNIGVPSGALCARIIPIRLMRTTWGVATRC